VFYILITANLTTSGSRRTPEQNCLPLLEECSIDKYSQIQHSCMTNARAQ